VAVGLPGVAMADQPSMDEPSGQSSTDEPVVQADLIPPGPSPDQADSGGAQPSTSDEDETVHKNGSFDGSPRLGQPTFGTEYAGIVSRETDGAPTISGSRGSTGQHGTRTGFGFVTDSANNRPSAPVSSSAAADGTAAIPGPRAMAEAPHENPMQEPTRAM